MSTAFTSIDDQRLNFDGQRRRGRARPMPEVALARATTEGTFSLFDDESLTIAAEEGLVIRVHSGCLWVPGSDEHCSGVREGDQFVCRRNETLRVVGCRGTEVELQWPARDRSSVSVH